MKKIVFFFLLLISAQTYAVELMQWERIPLQIKLNMGQERIIFVDKNVKVGYPAELEGKIRIQSAAGTVYLLASSPFQSTRLQLKNIETGELILLDVFTVNDDKQLEPVKIIYDDNVFNSANSNSMSTSQSATTQQPVPVIEKVPVVISLIRYAAQSLYAPLRAIEKNSGIQQVSTKLPDIITTLLPNQPIRAIPLGAWKKGNFTVTAIKLTNQSPSHINLDPRQLQGQFYAATFQHNVLGIKGSPEDTTTVYLITKGHGADKAIVPEPNH